MRRQSRDQVELGRVDRKTSPDGPKAGSLGGSRRGAIGRLADALISGNQVAGFSYIYVDTAYRHQGIGSALLRKVAGECQQRGAASMFAPMSRRAFYEANRFRAQREFVEMTKPLTA
ncbi:MAG: GNAT family N-acetyltransferase [Candidatus Latescibacteria bacterium]|nr:GNAT family N-acetyltransferase [Candidatus Latescibacterota bacterium]